MNEIKIIEKINELSSKIQTLKDEKKIKLSPVIEQLKIIEKHFDSQIYECNNSIQKIQNEYYDLALDVAINNQKCPVSRNGSHLTPNEVNIDDEGVNLTWIHEHPYNCDTYQHYTASWSEILAFQQKQLTEDKEG